MVPPLAENGRRFNRKSCSIQTYEFRGRRDVGRPKMRYLSDLFQLHVPKSEEEDSPK